MTSRQGAYGDDVVHHHLSDYFDAQSARPVALAQIVAKSAQIQRRRTDRRRFRRAMAGVLGFTLMFAGLARDGMLFNFGDTSPQVNSVLAAAADGEPLDAERLDAKGLAATAEIVIAGDDSSGGLKSDTKSYKPVGIDPRDEHSRRCNPQQKLGQVIYEACTWSFRKTSYLILRVTNNSDEPIVITAETAIARLHSGSLDGKSFFAGRVTIPSFRIIDLQPTSWKVNVCDSLLVRLKVRTLTGGWTISPTTSSALTSC